MKEIKFLDLNNQYLSIKDEIDSVIAEVIQSSAFIGGSYVKNFETEFAQYQGASYCVSCGNGTDALEIAIETLGLPCDSEIIVPANSFIASSEAVTRSGFRVVFADCDPENYTLSIDSVKSKITSKTKALIAVHLYGHPCDMNALIEIANEHHLKIIEDCAQAHGALYKGRKIGSIGDIGTFSFYPGKNLGAYGDGGAITTNSKELADKCRMIANHGRLAKYDHEFEGRNSRLDGLQAAILSVKLKHLDNWTESRIFCADYYLKELIGIGDLKLPVREVWATQVYHLFVIQTAKRDELKDYLTKLGIGCGIHYPVSLPKLQAYDYLGQTEEDLVANKCDSKLLSLPVGEHLHVEDLKYVVDTIREFFESTN